MIKSEINVKELSGGAFIIKWETPLELACPVWYNIYYREVYSPTNKGEWKSVTVNNNTTSYTIHLHCFKAYEMAVTAENSYGGNALNKSEVWNFKTQRGN